MNKLKVLGCLIFVVVVFFIGAGYGARHQRKLSQDGWTDSRGEFTPWSCERTRENGNQFDTGAERWLITTAKSIDALGRHQEAHFGLDATSSKEWHQPLVTIDYRRQHEVCVSHMPGLYSDVAIDKRCFNENGDFDKDLGGDDFDCGNSPEAQKYLGGVTRCFDLFDIGER